jgi:hypothetical protein
MIFKKKIVHDFVAAVKIIEVFGQLEQDGAKIRIFYIK